MFFSRHSSNLVSEFRPNWPHVESNMNSGLCEVSYQNSSFHNVFWIVGWSYSGFSKYHFLGFGAWVLIKNRGNDLGKTRQNLILWHWQNYHIHKERPQLCFCCFSCNSTHNTITANSRCGNLNKFGNFLCPVFCSWNRFWFTSLTHSNNSFNTELLVPLYFLLR